MYNHFPVQYYTDERLTWNPANYNGLTMWDTYRGSKQTAWHDLWTPILSVHNRRDARKKHS